MARAVCRTKLQEKEGRQSIRNNGQKPSIMTELRSSSDVSPEGDRHSIPFFGSCRMAERVTRCLCHHSQNKTKTIFDFEGTRHHGPWKPSKTTELRYLPRHFQNRTKNNLGGEQCAGPVLGFFMGLGCN